MWCAKYGDMYVCVPYMARIHFMCIYGDIERRRVYTWRVEGETALYMFTYMAHVHICSIKRVAHVVCHIWRHICMCAIYGDIYECVPYMETYMYVYYISMRAIYSTHTLHVYICLRPLDAHNGAAYIHIMCIDVSFVGLYTSKETYKRALQKRPTSHHARCTQWSGIHTHHVYR